ncbi:MAG TPA: hypothetical protein VFF20_04985 [Pseudogracilibacillus sp.]|nr:hypothetical protein [Pseudogracilibacillus sp.]
MSEHEFSWPSIEINEERKNLETKVELKQQSDLRSFGYQITGLNRMKHWNTLEQGVPVL